MQQTLNPTEISDLIRKRVEQFEVSSQARTEGTVVQRLRWHLPSARTGPMSCRG